MTFTDYPSRPRRIPTSEDYNNAEATFNALGYTKAELHALTSRMKPNTMVEQEEPNVSKARANWIEARDTWFRAYLICDRAEAAYRRALKKANS